MKKLFFSLIMAVAMLSMFACSGSQEPIVEEQTVITPQPVEAPAKNVVTDISPTKDNRYNYMFANFNATKPVAVYIAKYPFKQPSYVKYTAGKDTYTYNIPADFHIWKMVEDDNGTVWIAGWFKGYKEYYREYVFYGQSKYRGKVTPNSFIGKNGIISYR